MLIFLLSPKFCSVISASAAYLLDYFSEGALRTSYTQGLGRQ
jgi:hypothetical protein